ncbi:MAG: hypothetical protein U5L45_03980 [Saprospiraceae bacterium]|nr:hypothetical protein [Saprospiraceae bacterium]
MVSSLGVPIKRNRDCNCFLQKREKPLIFPKNQRLFAFYTEGVFHAHAIFINPLQKPINEQNKVVL